MQEIINYIVILISLCLKMSSFTVKSDIITDVSSIDSKQEFAKKPLIIM